MKANGAPPSPEESPETSTRNSNRAGVAVADASGETYRGVDDPAAQIVREPGRRRHLDDLLEVPLHAALALAEMGDRALDVAEYLHLHVAGAADELLDVEVAVAESGQCLGAAALVGRGHVARTFHQARAAATAAGDRLDHHAAPRVEPGEERRRLLDGDRVVDAAYDRHAGGPRRRTGTGLVAEQFEGLHTRTDEGQSRLAAPPGQVGVLRQEAVPGMDRVAAGVPGGGDDPVDVEVRRRADAVEGDGLVRLAGVQGAGVVARRDRDGGNAEFRRRPHDADRDFPPVRYQELHCFLVPTIRLVVSVSPGQHATIPQPERNLCVGGTPGTHQGVASVAVTHTTRWRSVRVIDH